MQNTKDRIMEVSIDLFSRQGFHAVSIRDITGQVGIKESTLYYHFKNKEQIINAIFAEYREAYQRMLPVESELERIVGSMQPLDFLRQGLINYKNSILGHPRMLRISRIIYMEQFAQKQARQILLQDVIDGSIHFVEKALQIMMDKGLIRSAPARQLAYEYQYPVFAMYMEYQLLQYDGKDTDALEQRMYTHAEAFIRRNIEHGGGNE